MSVMISDSTIQSIRDFVAERGWGQYHTPENLAKSISIEASEFAGMLPVDAAVAIRG